MRVFLRVLACVYIAIAGAPLFASSYIDQICTSTRKVVLDGLQRQFGITNEIDPQNASIILLKSSDEVIGRILLNANNRIESATQHTAGSIACTTYGVYVSIFNQMPMVSAVDDYTGYVRWYYQSVESNDYVYYAVIQNNFVPGIKFRLVGN